MGYLFPWELENNVDIFLQNNKTSFQKII